MNLSCALLLTIALTLITRSECKVKLKNNKYTGLVIAINPEIPEDPALIDAIKSAWRNASYDLFRATKRRAYFSKIKILVPQTWTDGNYAPSNGENYKKADVLVAYNNPAYGDAPYTLQYGRCGEPGTYMHLTPAYLLDDAAVTNWGPRGKTLVHEWAHYRWGVFDEVVTDGYDPFYFSSFGKVEANRCSIHVRGDNYYVDWANQRYRSCNTDQQTGLPEDGCTFIPDRFVSAAASSSMMSYQYLDSVYTFCGDDTWDPVNLHNREAPNEHNRQCNLRSTWEVISSSDDFRTDNQPIESGVDTEPDIEVVQPQSYQRFVLVLDVSGSMEGIRMQMMQQAASIFIMQAAPASSEVGMVEFSSKAKTLSDMVTINNNGDRQKLTKKLPDEADGGTSIGSGILEAIDVLEKGGKSAAGGVLIVLSDGQENEDPTLADVFDTVIAKGVVVNSIVFTDEADPMLQTIAIATGGIWYFSDEDLADSSTSSLTDAFVTVAKVNDGDHRRENLQIYSTTFTVTPAAQEIGRIIIDNTVGKNTIFTFTWSVYDKPLEVILMSPSGCNYATENVQDECDKSFQPYIDVSLKTIQFLIPGNAETGTWTYYVNCGSQYEQNVVVTGTSMARNLDVYPIMVESGMGTTEAAQGEAIVVYAKVSVGYAPVKKADVFAKIERPSGGPVTIRLKDKGAAPDIRRNDGVYSRYFTEYNGPGRYSVQVTVAGIKGQTVSASQQATSKAAFIAGTTNSDGSLSVNPHSPQAAPVEDETGEFSRYSSPGGFSYTGKAGTADVFPPNAISDLVGRQADVTKANSGIRIVFSAPGDDYDAGTAAGYEIRYTLGSFNNLMTDFESNEAVTSEDMMFGNLTMPQEAGSDEEFIFMLPDLENMDSTITVGVAVRAFDEAGNFADVSNVISVNYFFESPVVAEGDTNAEMIVMIIFILVSVILMCVVAYLVWKMQKMKQNAKVYSGDVRVNAVAAGRKKATATA